MCVQKDAIHIVWPDGSYATDIGVDVKTTYTESSGSNLQTFDQ